VRCIVSQNHWSVLKGSQSREIGLQKADSVGACWI